MTFLERCSICEYMVRDENVGDMICALDGKTCQSFELELLSDGLDKCDAFLQMYEYENLKDKE